MYLCTGYHNWAILCDSEAPILKVHHDFFQENGRLEIQQSKIKYKFILLYQATKFFIAVIDLFKSNFKSKNISKSNLVFIFSLLLAQNNGE